jgi:protein translocase SecG subunit
MYTFLIGVTLLTCVLMTLVILSQQSKGGASGQFAGSNANQMINAPQKMDILERLTWGMMSAIFVIVLLSSFFVGGGQATIDNTNIKEAQKKTKNAPAKTDKKDAEKKSSEKK